MGWSRTDCSWAIPKRSAAHGGLGSRLGLGASPSPWCGWDTGCGDAHGLLSPWWEANSPWDANAVLLGTLPFGDVIAFGAMSLGVSFLCLLAHIVSNLS